ncbi:unnamed protein product [Lymnaea stagnalis]|uniref:Uncharacterized protein n=1 Tax=Lymnaea stagnalis TaxID=6523 RepID=A0AAV2ILR1_LYMST
MERNRCTLPKIKKTNSGTCSDNHTNAMHYQDHQKFENDLVSSPRVWDDPQEKISNSKPSKKCKVSKVKSKKSRRETQSSACEVKGKVSAFNNSWKWKLFASQNGFVAVDPGSEDEWRFSSLVFAWGRERIFHLLGMLSLLICAILFILQAYMAFRSYQIMHQLSSKRQMPEMLYQIYFDGHDWAMDLDKVDLRANTTIFIH